MSLKLNMLRMVDLIHKYIVLQNWHEVLSVQYAKYISMLQPELAVLSLLLLFFVLK